MCFMYSICRYAQISIIGRHAESEPFFWAYSCGKMQMCSTVPVRAVKVIVLNLRSLAY